MKLYDENEAITYIIDRIGADAAVDKASILDVIDALYDYYEENDELDFDFDEDDEDLDADSDQDDVDAIIAYIAGKTDLPADTIRRIVIAEQQYQDTLL